MKPKISGYIRNLVNNSMVHIVYENGSISSIAFSIGHALEMIVDKEMPNKEYVEKDLQLLQEKYNQLNVN